LGKEIERKFLVLGEEWKNQGSGIKYYQGYLSTEKARTVRVRIVDKHGYITIKSRAQGASRLEFEYSIPYDDAIQLLDLCKKPLIEKIRYEIEFEGLTWEVDEFEGLNKGLILAEVELEDENQIIIKPNWIGDEVTGQSNYFNSNLIKNPYSLWK
jgi:CYTH domain-containing protein